MTNAISFIPAPRVLARRTRHRKLVWIAMNIGVVALGALGTIAARAILLGGHAVPASAITAAESRLEAINTEHARLAAELGGVESRLQGYAEATQHPDWSILIGYISHISKGSITLDAFALEPGNTRGTYRVALAGLAQSQNQVTDFVLGLERAGVFTKTELVRSNRTPEGGSLFAISCQIGDATAERKAAQSGAQQGATE